MASDRHPGNVDGPFFVDTRCINCDASRQLAPDLFAIHDRQSVVRRQPTNDDETAAMWRAVLACPTNSIRTDPPQTRPRGLFPQHLAGPVHYLGHNSPKSFGANSFLVERPGGNLLVDSPRWTRNLVAPVEDLGGIAQVLLTHRDDVADADRWAEHFGAERVWIHEWEADAAPYATDHFTGLDTTTVADGVDAVPIPGHTRGSVAFVVDDEYLLSGDSLYWRRSNRPGVHVQATWYSLEEQSRSLRRLATSHRFRWVFAGHGDRNREPIDDLPEQVVALCGELDAR